MNARRLVSRFAGVLRASVALLAVVVLAGLCFAASAFAGEGFGVTGTFGSAGAGNGEFERPNGIAVNQSNGDVYVVDSGNHRVEYFSAAGAYLGQFNGADNPSYPAGFNRPQGIAVDNACFYHGLSEPECAKTYPSNGDVYVLDAEEGVLEKFSATGSFISQLGPLPFFDKNFASVAVDNSGNVWVAEDESSRNVSEYSETGFETGTHEQQFTTFGGGKAVAVDSADNVYMTLKENQLGKFNSDGAQLQASETEAITPVQALAVDLQTNDLLLSLGESIAQYGPFGEPFSAPLYSSGAHAVPGVTSIAVNSTSHAVYASSFLDSDVTILGLGPKPAAPSTEAPGAISATGATFHGTVTRESSGAIEYYFEYNADALCTGGTQTTPQSAAAGTGTLAVQAAVSGLLPDQSYSVCLVASNGYGPSAGPAVHLTTVAVAPEVIASSESSSAVTPFGAHVEALVNPNNQTTACEVQYGKTTAYGDKVACEPASLTGYSPAGQSVGLNISGLEPETTYHYRVVAVNASHEQTTGADEQFTTTSLQELVIQGESVAAEGPFEATLQAEVNPNYQATTCVFEFAAQAAQIGTKAAKTLPCEPEHLGNGGGGVDASARVSGLSGSTTYYYRVIATNASGTKEGATEEFTTPTPEPPSFLVQLTESTTASTASLIAGINPNYQATSCHVEYGTEPLLVSAVSTVGCDPEDLGDGAGLTFPGATLTGLEPRTLYYYRFVAENAAHEKTVAPENGEFTTLGAPLAVVTGEAQELTRTSATLTGGSVNPGGLEASYHFVYLEAARYQEAVADGEADPYLEGQSTSETALGASDFAEHQVAPVQITGLHAGVTYDYALLASNTEGTTTGPSETFTTSPATPPSVTGVSAAAGTPSTASITFTLNPEGLPTRWELRLGASPGVLAYRASGSSSGGEPEALTVSLETLSPATTYYYTLTAVNTDDQTQPTATPEATFTTPAGPPVQTLPLASFPQTPSLTSLLPANAFGPEEPGTITITKTVAKCTKGKKLSHGKCVKEKAKHKRKTRKGRKG